MVVELKKRGEFRGENVVGGEDVRAERGSFTFEFEATKRNQTNKNRACSSYAFVIVITPSFPLYVRRRR